MAASRCSSGTLMTATGLGTLTVSTDPLLAFPVARRVGQRRTRLYRPLVMPISRLRWVARRHPNTARRRGGPTSSAPSGQHLLRPNDDHRAIAVDRDQLLPPTLELGVVPGRE